MRRLGFTMLELVFVIVIMGILGKFGVEFLAQAYNSFIFSSINNTLQAQSSLALKSVASKLQYRIKDSVIVRNSNDANFATNFVAIANADPNLHNIIEWVGSDIEGYRGNSRPNWSGIIDLDASSATILNSPETNTTAINNLINVLSYTDSGIANAALYFIGSDNDILNGYGWDGVALADHNNSVMQRINLTGNPTEFQSGIGLNFGGVDVYEYYQLAWTAYAVGITDYNIGANAGTNTGTLMLFYDYQPWEGDTYLLQNDGTVTKSEILMQNVSTFQFQSIGSIVKIQVCVNSDVMGDYSLCKEKTIF
ncbi:MAG: prepilin-type N-terminal cleavage/methylation domain-containing protein [Sulfurimonas sp.]|nr:prepilin-type N-terminal cleavage/methylation domain-containing protein [Sulfurimonas sp.]